MARGSADLTPATGARGSRTSARGPVGRATTRSGHCPARRAVRTAPVPGAWPGPPYLPPAAGLGPPRPPRPPPPSWAPQGPYSLTLLPQGAGAGAKAASAPRGTLRPLRKPHSAASGDHGDGRGAAAPPSAREGSGAQAGAGGAFAGARLPARGGGGRGTEASTGAPWADERGWTAGTVQGHGGCLGSPSFGPRVTGFSVGEEKKQVGSPENWFVWGEERREIGSTSFKGPSSVLKSCDTSLSMPSLLPLLPPSSTPSIVHDSQRGV